MKGATMHIHTFYIGSTSEGIAPYVPEWYCVPRYHGPDITFAAREVWGVTPQWGVEQTLRVTSDQPMTDQEATDVAAMLAVRYGQDQVLVSRESRSYSRFGARLAYVEDGPRTVAAPWNTFPVGRIGGYAYEYPVGDATHAAWLVDSTGRESSLFD